MEALEPRGRRFESALEMFLLKDRCMTYRGVNFWLAPDGYLEVRVHPDWKINRDEAQEKLDDLGFSRCVAEELTSASPAFASAVKDLPWRMVRLNASGTGVVWLHCPEEDKVIWSLGRC